MLPLKQRGTLLGMPIIKGVAPDPSFFRYEIHDGYEQGGLLYFRFEGQEMVAIVRDRAQFEKHLKAGTPLQAYVNTLVSDRAYGAALEIEKLIPEKPL